MESIIGDCQSAFVKGKNILDGIVILNEVIEEAKKGRKKRFIFKVDFAKAYDSVEWDFLLTMMERMNFPTRWRQWMAECISSASANVLVNGSPSGEFDLKRGIRQGDPLSPFLFLIAAEGLNALVGRAVDRGRLHPVEVGRDKVLISHLQYADDTLFVVEGNSDNAKVIKGILCIFENLSGLSVNFEKCSVVGINMPEVEIQSLVNLFGCSKGGLPLNYLGMKVGGGIGSLSRWDDVVERVRRRLGGWKVKSLSLGGRVTLINSVLAAIPTFRMAFSPIPAGVEKVIKTLQRKFLWGEEGDGPKKVAWTKWEDICRSKEEGGLGVKNLKWFSGALLGKWCWRFLNESESLWVRIIRSRHSVAELEKRGSFGEGCPQCKGWWGKVLKVTKDKFGDWFFPLLERKIGDGMSTKFWYSKWGGGPPPRERFPRLYHLSTNKDGLIGEMRVWSEQRWEWRIGWTRALRGRDEEEWREMGAWLDGVRLERDKRDAWRWGADGRDGKGLFTVKEAYATIAQRAGRRQNWAARDTSLFKALWKTEAPLKFKCVGWRVLRNRLPTRELLSSRIGLTSDEKRCPGCNEQDEELRHLLLSCVVACRMWASVLQWVGVSWVALPEIGPHFESFANLVRGKGAKKVMGALWICVIWVIWKWRNEVIFQNVEWDLRRMVEETKCRFWSWISVKRRFGGSVSFLDWSSRPLFDSMSLV